MNLGTLANLAEIFGAVVVIGGVAFAVIQIQLYRRHRVEAAAMETMRQFTSEEFIEGFLLLSALPDNITAEELRSRSPQLEECAMKLGMIIETVGVMTYHRIGTFRIVDDVVGGAIMLLWRKVNRWVYDLREEKGVPTIFEWFEWLNDRLQEHSRKKTGYAAQTCYKDWRP